MGELEKAGELMRSWKPTACSCGEDICRDWILNGSPELRLTHRQAEAVARALNELEQSDAKRRRSTTQAALASSLLSAACQTDLCRPSEIPRNPGLEIGACVNPYVSPSRNPIQARALTGAGIRCVRVTEYSPGHGLDWWIREGFEVLGVAGEDTHAWSSFIQNPRVFVERFTSKSSPAAWEFFNEPDLFARISAREYIAGLRTARALFTGTLVSAAPADGSGARRYFQEMLEAGLLEIPDLVIGVHDYGGAARLADLLKGRRVWITEGGAGPWREQEKNYARILRTAAQLGAERVYLYVAWEGEPADNTNGLFSIDWATDVFRGGPIYQKLSRPQ